MTYVVHSSASTLASYKRDTIARQQFQVAFLERVLVYIFRHIDIKLILLESRRHPSSAYPANKKQLIVSGT